MLISDAVNCNYAAGRSLEEGAQRGMRTERQVRHHYMILPKLINTPAFEVLAGIDSGRFKLPFG
jgi:hypothetical protein